MFFPVIFHTPLIRACIITNIALEFRPRIDTFEFSMPPQRSVNGIRFAAIFASKRSSLQFDGPRCIIYIHTLRRASR